MPQISSLSMDIEKTDFRTQLYSMNHGIWSKIFIFIFCSYVCCFLLFHWHSKHLTLLARLATIINIEILLLDFQILLAPRT